MLYHPHHIWYSTKSFGQSVHDTDTATCGSIATEAENVCHGSSLLQLNERKLSVDGHELNFATNTLGTFLLTHLLEDAVVRGGPGSRVITVTSGGAYTEPLVSKDMEMPAEGFDGSVAYARDKRRQIALTERFAERLKSQGVGCGARIPVLLAQQQAAWTKLNLS